MDFTPDDFIIFLPVTLVNGVPLMMRCDDLSGQTLHAWSDEQFTAWRAERIQAMKDKFAPPEPTFNPQVEINPLDEKPATFRSKMGLE